MDTGLTHVFDYNGIKVHVIVCEGLVCISPQDTLKCLGFKDDNQGSLEEMGKKLVSMKHTRKGLAFAHWVKKVVLPAMEK